MVLSIEKSVLNTFDQHIASQNGYELILTGQQSPITELELIRFLLAHSGPSVSLIARLGRVRFCRHNNHRRLVVDLYQIYVELDPYRPEFGR